MKDDGSYTCPSNSSEAAQRRIREYETKYDRKYSYNNEALRLPEISLYSKQGIVPVTLIHINKELTDIHAIGSVYQ